MSGTVAIILAGGSIEGFGVLTLNRAKAALPFAGHYRIIDFSLSSLINSGIERIGIIMQYMPSSLIEHIGSGRAWDLIGFERAVKIMPPFVGKGHTDWFNGTADAIYKNINFIEDFAPDNVLIVSGDHIYKEDFTGLIKFHTQRDADLTIVSKKLTSGQFSNRFGYLDVDSRLRVKFFKEKPKRKISDIASVGIYLFKTESLINALIENAAAGTSYNLTSDVIENLVPGEKIFAHSSDGYWEYLEDIGKYYNVSMEIISSESSFKIEDWEVLTNLEDRYLSYRTPTVIKPGAKVNESLLSPGCAIEGSVHRSILSPGVIVEKGAVVEDSIIMHDCIAKSGAFLKNIVADKDVYFDTECRIDGSDKNAPQNEELPKSIKGLSLIGKGAVIGKNVQIGANCQVYPKVSLELFKGRKFGPALNIR